jgi:hypothetical protein
MANTSYHPLMHGHCKRGQYSPTYHSWASMVQRCTNPRRTFYHRYGGRGISVCKRWLEFQNFLLDMGERPHNTSLERKDVDGNYNKANCIWATPEMQMNNTSRNILVTIGSRTQSVAMWVRELELNVNTVRARIRKWGDPYKALTHPLHTEKKRR